MINSKKGIETHENASENDKIYVFDRQFYLFFNMDQV